MLLQAALHPLATSCVAQYPRHQVKIYANILVSWYAKTQRLAGKFGVEQRGIERVPSDERENAHISQVGTMWLSANMVVSSFALGALAYPIFYLGFIDTILIILFVNLLGILPVCFFSTFGPKFGLRQMVLSRFFFGVSSLTGF